MKHNDYATPQAPEVDAFLDTHDLDSKPTTPIALYRTAQDADGYTDGDCAAMAKDWANQSVMAELPDDWSDNVVQFEPYARTIPYETPRTAAKIAGLTFSSGDEMALTAKAPVYLIKGLLEEDAHGIMYGASMSFKTFTTLSIAHSICTGADFMGRKVKKTGKVLYVCGEGDGAMKRRTLAQVKQNGGFNGNFMMLNGTIRIDNKDDMAQLKLAIDEIKPVLVIFDTFASLVSSTNEQDNSDVGQALNLIKETCRNGSTSSIVVHHTGKDESNGARGASAFKNNVDFSFELKRKVKAMQTEMSCEKMKDGEDFLPVHMMAAVVDLGIFDEDGEEARSIVMQKSDYIPANDVAALDSEERKILNALQTAIDDDGIIPPRSIVDMFPDSPENAPKKVTSIREWFDCSLDLLTVNSTPEKESAAKRSRHNRVRAKLVRLGIVCVHGDYVWAANPLQATRE